MADQWLGCSLQSENIGHYNLIVAFLFTILPLHNVRISRSRSSFCLFHGCWSRPLDKKMVGPIESCSFIGWSHFRLHIDYRYVVVAVDFVFCRAHTNAINVLQCHEWSCLDDVPDRPRQHMACQ